jgi:hypothetical protein
MAPAVVGPPGWGDGEISYTGKLRLYGILKRLPLSSRKFKAASNPAAVQLGGSSLTSNAYNACQLILMYSECYN